MSEHLTLKPMPSEVVEMQRLQDKISRLEAAAQNTELELQQCLQSLADSKLEIEGLRT